MTQFYRITKGHSEAKIKHSRKLNNYSTRDISTDIL